MKVNVIRTVELAVVVSLVLSIVGGLWLMPEFFNAGSLEGVLHYLQSPITP